MSQTNERKTGFFKSKYSVSNSSNIEFALVELKLKYALSKKTEHVSLNNLLSIVVEVVVGILGDKFSSP